MYKHTYINTYLLMLWRDASATLYTCGSISDKLAPCMYVHVCLYVCMYVCVYINMYIYTRWLPVCMSMYVCMYACMTCGSLSYPFYLCP